MPLVPLFLLLVPSAASAMPPYVPLAATTPAGALQMELSGGWFSSEGWWDEEGTEWDLPQGDSFTQMDAGLAARYGFGRNVEFFGGVGWRSVSAVSRGLESSASGPTSVRGGARVSLLRRGPWLLSAEGSHAQTMYDDEVSPQQQGRQDPAARGFPGDDPTLGVAGSTTEGSARLTWLYSPGTALSASLGYRLTPGHLASEVPWRAELALHGDRWALSFGGDGAVSMEDDDYANVEGDGLEAGNRPVYFSPATKRFNSFHRSWTRAFAGLSFATGPWRAGVEAGRFMGGTSTDRGFEVGAALAWTIKGGAGGLSRVGAFKEYSEEALVMRVSPRGKFIKIDKGRSRGVDKGTKVDVFKSDPMGENVLYASGVVYESTNRSSIVMLRKLYVKRKVEKGFTARIYE